MRRQLVAVAAEPIADDTFHVIAFVGTFGGFLTDHQPQARMTQTVVTGLRHVQQIAAFAVSQRKNG